MVIKLLVFYSWAKSPRKDGFMLLKKMPNFSFIDLNGKEFSTERLLGKKTLIFMWASW